MLAAGDAAAASRAATRSDAWHKWLPPALSLFVPLLALGLYLQTGRPGLPAAPFADRGADRGADRAPRTPRPASSSTLRAC